MRRFLTKRGIGVGIVVVALVGLGGYFFLRSQRLSGELKLMRQGGGEREVEALVEKVGKLVVLPEGEVPTVATVTEKEKLIGQAFFAQAENGDKVLIYTQAKKAILYDPESNRVLEIAPVNIGETVSDVASGAAELKREHSFVVRNGAGIAGVAGRFSQVIEEKIKGARIVETGNAEKSDYEQSLLVGVGVEETEAKRVAEVLNLSLGELPVGESTPSGDFLVIVGRDKASD